MHTRLQTVISNPIPQTGAAGRLYTPSFVDRIMGAVQRLPGPYWLPLLVLIVVQSIITHVVAWMDGWLPAYTSNPVLFLFPAWLWGPFAVMIYLNSIAVEALDCFRPFLDVDEEALNRRKYEFTTMPSRGVIVNGVVWSIAYAVGVYWIYDAFFVANGLGTFLTVFLIVEGLVSFSTGSAVYYHSLRQLKLVYSTLRTVKRVNLFQLDPVYAFSRVTARTGISWMILLALTLVLYPMQLANALLLATLVVQVTLAVAAFVLPLRSVNQHLVSEKRRLIAELNQRVERTLERLHRSLDGEDLGDVEKLHDAIATLNAERDLLAAIPTWPWRAGTLTGFLSAIALPVVLFVIQFVIERWLSG